VTRFSRYSNLIFSPNDNLKIVLNVQFCKVKNIGHIQATENCLVVTRIVIYTKSEEGKAFVHANCVFVHEAQLSGRYSSSERKRSYFRVLYLVFFDTSLRK
jgi:hypothetical protein